MTRRAKLEVERPSLPDRVRITRDGIGRRNRFPFFLSHGGGGGARPAEVRSAAQRQEADRKKEYPLRPHVDRHARASLASTFILRRPVIGVPEQARIRMSGRR